MIKLVLIRQFYLRAVPEKSMSPPGRQLIFFSMGHCAIENFNSVGGRFEFGIKIIVWVVGNIKLFYVWWVTAVIY